MRSRNPETAVAPGENKCQRLAHDTGLRRAVREAMSRTEKLRRICDRLIVESNRLDSVAEALLNAELPLESRQIKRWSRCVYQLHISLGELADDIRSPKGMKRRANTSSSTQTDR